MPWELLEAQLCERFHKFPEELDGADVGRIVRGLRLLDAYNIGKLKANGQELDDDGNRLLGQLLQMEIELGN